MPPDELVAIDRWALWRTQQLQEEVIAAYRNYQFHLIYQKVHNFCSVDLGGFYLDVLKDRLYTTPAKSCAALGADRDVLDRRGDGALARADPVVHGGGDLAVHAGRAQRVGVLQYLGVACRKARHSARRSMGCVLRVRSGVTRELEKLRNAGAIGAPLDAEVDVYCAAHVLQVLQAFGEELRFVFITSAARVHRADSVRPRRLRRRRETTTSRGSSCGRQRRRSACAAGTSARTWVAMRSIRSCAAVAS